MPQSAELESLFFDRTGMDRVRVEGILEDALKGADDGELFMEYCQSEGLVFDDGRLKTASFDTSQGFGLRSIAGEAAGYAHSSELSEDAVKRAAEAISAVHSGHDGSMDLGPGPTNRILYEDINPLNGVVFEKKVKLLAEIDAFARGLDPRVVQVSASISGEWQAISILRANGESAFDVRPLVRLNVSVVMAEGDRMETGGFGGGGRFAYDSLIEPEYWQMAVKEALRRAEVNLGSIDAPAGEMQVVLGPGWPGVLLHEAVGHGLEGDFNRKETSAFSGLLGQKVASKGVTVVDDGTLADRRGSLTVDDEG
ncbi:MAG: metallopeptidase TldD-related protein, partial [Kiloniellales bacterium]|nr:metallopeptidase TldD-related protein [Kiloniellales bacterium]